MPAHVARVVEAQQTHLDHIDHMTRVVAGVAHEFNNLLTPILMGAEALRERAAGAADRRTLDSVMDGADGGHVLIAVEDTGTGMTPEVLARRASRSPSLPPIASARASASRWCRASSASSAAR